MLHSGGPLKVKDDDSVTYVDGLGVIPSKGGKSVYQGVRLTANLTCLIFFIYVFCCRMFVLPMTYLAYLLGFNVSINRFTGLVVKSEFCELFIVLLSNGISFLIAALLVSALCCRGLPKRELMRRSHTGVIPIALPITFASGIFGGIGGILFGRLCALFGLVVYTEPLPIRTVTPFLLLSFATAMLLGILEEIFFRGIILASLRRFGDGFAVVSSALLFAFWANGVVEGIGCFLFGVCTGYFVIRSGSVHLAIYSRVMLLLASFLSRMIQGMLEPSLGEAVLIVCGILVLAAALIAYLYYVKADPNAFRLVEPQDGIGTRGKIGAFCGSAGFILLVISMAAKIINTIQIIG